MISASYNESLCVSNVLAKVIICTAGAIAVIGIALSIIGLSAPCSGPFNCITQLGPPSFHGILLGFSVFALILDVIAIKALCGADLSEVDREGIPIEQTSSSLVKEKDKCEETHPPHDQRKKQSQEKTTIHALPDEILLNVFFYLNVKQLGKCGRVSRRWHNITKTPELWKLFDLKKLSPKLRIFDEKDWIRYAPPQLGLDTSDLQPLNHAVLIPFLFKQLGSHKIKDDAGFTLLTVPKNLTLDALKILAETPKEGNSTNFILGHPQLLKQYVQMISKTQPVAKSYHVLIANGLIPHAKEPLFIRERDKTNWPDLLSMSTLVLTTFISTYPPLRLLREGSFVICSDYDIILSCTYLIVGNFDGNGLHADSQVSPDHNDGKRGFGFQIKISDDFYLTSPEEKEETD